ncbi:MAG: SDR family NAD(P)-dependent oxidoreductase, partial [Rhizobiales bacterium]|nr:SDR family NAD(P)-dependent oxidoreductase [Hyphomicrobiales bacterium]
MQTQQELFTLTGKIAVVTGGGRGLGRIAAEALLRAGARVLVASRKKADCVATADALAGLGDIEGLEGDVSTQAGVSALVAQIRQRTPVVDILLNNAGATWGASLESFPWDAWSKVMSVNVTGAFTLTRDLLPELSARASLADPSRVINVGSILGTAPIPDDSYSYGASKAALHHVTRVLAGELAPRHITVNAIAPGPFESKMTAFALGKTDVKDSIAASIP